MKNEIIRFVLYIILLGSIFSGLAVAGLNARPVLFDYFIGTSYVSLSLLLVSVLILGSVLGMLVSLWLLIRLQCENRALKKKIYQPLCGDDAPMFATGDETVAS